MLMNKIKKLSLISHRIIAAILIFCMVFETGVMHVYAAEYEFEYTENTELSDTDADSDDSSNNDSENSDDNSSEHSDIPGDSNDSSGEQKDESADAGINDTNKDDDATENNNNDSIEGNDDSESIENNDEPESIENDDNAILNDDSDNTSNRTKPIGITDAEEAFENIVSAKDVMALIYMTNVYHVRRHADAKSDVVADLESGHTVYLLGVTITPDKVWFRVQFWVNGTQMEGYVERGNLAYSDEDWLKWNSEYLYKLADNGLITQAAVGGIKTLAASYEDVAQFPAGYQTALTQLKSAHPKWIFVPMNTGLDFETAVTKEMGDKSLIQNTSSNASKGWVGSACPTESGWYYATRDAVSYHMDPRNFFTESYIFQFEQLTFNSSYHTAEAIQTFLNSTFMKGTLSDDAKKRTYAQAFYEIGSSRKLSPIHLASRVYLEQGQGNSGLISGTYPGYEGYYNYFNVGVNGASETEKIVKGLTYAKNQGWNTRYKSLEGGAATIGNNYILKGQDTIYLEKFNVDSNSPYGLYNHQYMQNIQAPASESSSSRKMYANTGSLDSAFVFKIPVYNNMSNPIPLLGITLDKESITLRRPDTVVEDDSYLNEDEKKSNISSTVLNVTFDPEDTTDDKTIVWTSSNKKVATVENGIVTAVGTGEATITATAANAGSLTAQCTVTVIAPVYKIEFTSEYNMDTILVGQSANLSAEYFPKDTTSDTTVWWASSDTSVIFVSDETKGSIRGVNSGTADVIATIGGYSARHRLTVESCNVTFKDADNAASLMTLSTAYGDTISEDSFNKVEKILNTPDDSIFIDWYTEPDGKGSRFDSDTKIYQKETIVYPYFVKRGGGFIVIPIGDQTYTGSAIKPDLIVYDIAVYENARIKDAGIKTAGLGNSTLEDTGFEDMRLKLNQDYTISYKNNKKAASADSNKPPTITVKGKGNYAGTQIITFNIVPKALTDTDITFDNITAAYTGKTIKSLPTLYRNGKKLTKNTDYKLTYPQTGSGAYQNAGTYPIIITGTGGYSGTLTVYETISRKTLLSKVKIAKIPNQVYEPEKIKKGTGMQPQLTVTYKNTTLAESTDGGITGDYVVSYANNLNIGTATATITAVGNNENYIGSKSITFKITGTSINKAVISGVEPKTYTGIDDDVKQDDNISVSFDGEQLISSIDKDKYPEKYEDRPIDYVLEYKNINKAGTATVIIKGVNKYTGTKKITYKINACDFSQVDMTDIIIQYCPDDADKNNDDSYKTVNSLNDITTPYVKGGVKPAIKLYYKVTIKDKEKVKEIEKELKLGKDYTVKYKNNNALTTADMPQDKMPLITITGKGNFKGSISGTFKITDGAMSDDNGKITMTAKDIVYKSKQGAYRTSVTLTDANGKKLQAGKDYAKTLRYTYVEDTSITTIQGENVTRAAGDEVGENDLPNIGTAIRVTVTGIGAYAVDIDATASKSTIYHIVAADISKAKVTVAPKTYIDKYTPITLTETDITVTLNGNELVFGEDNDYVIETDTYVGNNSKGKATVIIRGTGTNYGGTKKVKFTINGKTLSWFR